MSILKGKNYKLHKFLVAKTGVIVACNKDGRVWIELRFAGKLMKEIVLQQADTWTKRDLKKLRTIITKFDY